MRGFSLVELLVAMAAGLLTLLLVGSLFRLETRLVSREGSAQDRRDALRRVLASMAREIRVAGHDPVATGSFDGDAHGVFHAGPHRLEVRSDVQGDDGSGPPDGELDERSRERITFLVRSSSRSVSMKIGNQSVPLLAGVTTGPADLRFEYLDACGEAIPPGSNGVLSATERRKIRGVRLHLGVTDPTGRTDRTSTLVTLRNRTDRNCAPTS